MTRGKRAGNRSKCRSCDAEILWVKTQSGKNMPVDYNEDIAYLWADGKSVEFEPGLGMVSHFSTCPEADQFRKGKNA